MRYARVRRNGTFLVDTEFLELSFNSQAHARGGVDSSGSGCRSNQTHAGDSGDIVRAVDTDIDINGPGCGLYVMDVIRSNVAGRINDIVVVCASGTRNQKMVAGGVDAAIVGLDIDVCRFIGAFLSDSRTRYAVFLVSGVTKN